MEILILIGAGLIVGLVSSFFGIGGGVILIPILYYLFPKLDPINILAISLGTIFINSLINSMNFYQKKLLPKPSSILILLCSCLMGSIIGHFILEGLSPKNLKYIFASVAFLTALRTLIVSIIFKGQETKQRNFSSNQKINLILFFAGMLGSILSAITGLGGGVIFIPLLLIVNIPLIKISPYSNVAMGFASLFAFTPHLFTKSSFELMPYNSILFNFGKVGRVYFLIIFFFLFGSTLTSKIGVLLNEKVSPLNKGILFSILLFYISLKIFLKA